MKRISIFCVLIFILLGCKEGSQSSKSHDHAKLPDTGQGHTGLSINFGEDGDHSINSMSYSDLSDGTITDNVTGLMWQQNGSYIASDWYDADSFCNSFSLGGYNDWRLPTVKALITIVNLNYSNPSIDALFFTNTVGNYYWTSSVNPDDSTKIYNLSFLDGSLSSGTSKSTANINVRCVRGNQYSNNEFQNIGSDMVLDVTFGLIWQKYSSQTLNWEDAINYCEDLNLNNLDDWRLPNYKEIFSLISYNHSFPAINTFFFPDGDGVFKTSSTLISKAGFNWSISFDQASLFTEDWSITAKVRCVRGGGSEDGKQVSATISYENFPDTGQAHTNYTSYFGQDGDYSLNTPDYSDPLNGTIIDKVTGLIWQQDGSNSVSSWTNADGYCDTLSIAGSSDWRLPTAKELLSIVDLNENNPAINPSYFTNTSNIYYWASTSRAGDTTTAYALRFSDGQLYAVVPKATSGYYVRCVNGEELSDSRYKEIGDDMVLDLTYGYVWQKYSNQSLSWVDAINYCENLSFGNYDDWRLPSYKEIYTLMDHNHSSPAIDTDFFPDGDSLFKTSSTIINAAGSNWSIDFDQAGLYSQAWAATAKVRCVRGG